MATTRSQKIVARTVKRERLKILDGLSGRLSGARYDTLRDAKSKQGRAVGD